MVIMFGRTTVRQQVLYRYIVRTHHIKSVSCIPTHYSNVHVFAMANSETVWTDKLKPSITCTMKTTAGVRYVRYCTVLKMNLIALVSPKYARHGSGS